MQTYFFSRCCGRGFKHFIEAKQKGYEIIHLSRKQLEEMFPHLWKEVRLLKDKWCFIVDGKVITEWKDKIEKK